MREPDDIRDGARGAVHRVRRSDLRRRENGGRGQRIETRESVIELWQQARCAVVGVGAPPLLRSSLPAFVPTDSSLATAVGDVCNRYFDRAGGPVTFPGSEHLIAIGEEQLRALPDCIAVAGREWPPRACRGVI